ncbi:MAG: NAD(P)H-dependent flavin oxidoreductase [Gammaproteobacteria bacterium]
MPETSFTRLTGCKVPVQSVPVAGITTVEFVAAVCNAGGLGMLSAVLAPAPAIAAMATGLRELTEHPFGINFLVPFLEGDYQAVELAADSAPVVEFFYAEPDRQLVDRVHQGGALCSWQTGSVDEARQAADIGCDFIIQQGVEAGGHVRGRSELLSILAETVQAVSVPVLAAGGIANGADVAAMLRQGAAGVRVGTRFVCSVEARAHAEYKQALVEAGAEQTSYTEAFSVMWPNAPHRVLQSSIEAMNACEDDYTGEWQIGGERMPIPRGSVIAPTDQTTGRIEAMALYAGHSVDRINSVETVTGIMQELLSELDSNKS